MADPKRSVFDPDPPKVKGVPESQRARDPEPAKDKGGPDHEKGLIDSIKGLIAKHSQAPGGTDSSGKVVSTNEAVEAMSGGIKSVPGNTTDY